MAKGAVRRFVKRHKKALAYGAGAVGATGLGILAHRKIGSLGGYRAVGRRIGGAVGKRDEAVKAAQSAKAAGEQTVQEVRPQLITALRTLNDEMQKLIDRLEAEPSPTPETPPDEPPAEPPMTA